MNNWRIIPLETHSAALHMALDEACGEAVAAGKSLPTIRFYQWSPSAVSIGYFQSLMDEVDTELCKQMNVDIVRRRTGGGAVYHDHDGEITYSILAPESMFSKDITASYHELCGWIVKSLSLLGFSAEFKPINDIIVSGKKISGNAQTRRGGILQQHGTILYDVDLKKMFSLLKVDLQKISDKQIAAVEERVTSIKKLKPELAKDDVYQALLKGFTDGKNFTLGSWTEMELDRARELVTKKYAAERWTRMR